MTRNATTTATATKTAHETYADQAKAVAAQMKRLRVGLASHAKAEKSNPKSWCNSGDLGHVSEQLDEILAFIGA